ncbi:Histone acetyltransferase type B subunit 2 [Nakaseomyces bracarensis]|uniref:Histone acetyltransferase type B subunit 2 n=1 Tax=Nakaseomyces bracarensis TaxID=273131 RepID=A0ABR4P0Z2_9SACH
MDLSNLSSLGPEALQKMAEVAAAAEQQNQQPMSIDEEYELWKSNVPAMYDFVSETRMTWPSLTLEWLPQHNLVSSRNRQQMIIGTHTSGEEQNYLKVGAVDLPDEIVQATKENSSEADDGEFPIANVKIIKKFPHEEEITRARYMPADDNIIATINGSGKMFIYDRSKDSEEGLLSTLSYHTENGYGLSFNPLEENKLLSGSDDSNVAIWDISRFEKDIKPLFTIEAAHNDIVNDVKWHMFDSNIFGTVAEDSTMKLFDQRSQKETISVTSKQAYNTLAFSPFARNLFAAAGTENLVYLYDMRNTAQPLYAMTGHEDAVTSLEFDPSNDGIIVSAGADRRVIVWDIEEIGAEQQQDELEDGAPEILMIHAGHRSAINDISINPNIPWLTASTEEENIVQVWKCSSNIPRIGGAPNVDLSILS